MGESTSTWWFSAEREWHQGPPPADWWQAPDGRWHPPLNELDDPEGASAPSDRRRRGHAQAMAAGEALAAVANARIRPGRVAPSRRRRLWSRITGHAGRLAQPLNAATEDLDWGSGQPGAPRLWPGTVRPSNDG
jgi:hypothetical protein